MHETSRYSGARSRERFATTSPIGVQGGPAGRILDFAWVAITIQGRAPKPSSVSTERSGMTSPKRPLARQCRRSSCFSTRSSSSWRTETPVALDERFREHERDAGLDDLARLRAHPAQESERRLPGLERLRPCSGAAQRSPSDRCFAQLERREVDLRALTHPSSSRLSRVEAKQGFFP